VLAKPRLVVASASKPTAARIRAVPASHGLGMMNAPGADAGLETPSLFPPVFAS